MKRIVITSALTFCAALPNWGWAASGRVTLASLAPASHDAADDFVCPQCQAKEGSERSGMYSLVLKFAHFDSLFQSVIDDATHRGDGYSLKYKLYF